jgi:hypothetical protein
MKAALRSPKSPTMTDIVCCKEHRWERGEGRQLISSTYTQIQSRCNDCAALKIITRHDLWDKETKQLTFQFYEVVLDPNGTIRSHREWKEDWEHNPPQSKEV